MPCFRDGLPAALGASGRSRGAGAGRSAFAASTYTGLGTSTGSQVVSAGSGPEGEDVVVAHADDPALRSLAVLDVVLNNADRKAAHLTLDVAGTLRGFDHGLCLHRDDKLRTVLWGWAGTPLRDEDVLALTTLQAVLEDATQDEAPDPGTPYLGSLASLLDAVELDALRSRVTSLLAEGSMPLPPGDRYPLPWPLW